MRNTRILHFTFLVFFIFVSNSIGSTVTEKVLDVQQYAQQTVLWCWAASAEMIMCSHHVKKSQCRQVKDLYPEYQAAGINCCNFSDPHFNRCITTGEPQYQDYGFSFTRFTYNILQYQRLQLGYTPKEYWDIIVYNINRNQAVGFAHGRYNIDGTLMGGHYMVVKGYGSTGPNKWLLINDPLDHDRLPNRDKKKGGSSRLITFEEFLESNDGELSCIDHDIIKID